MKLNFFPAVVLLVLLPRYQCRSLDIRQPLLLGLGEEHFLRLGRADSQPKPDEAPSQNTQLWDSLKRGKRSEEHRISLDLTFHLLREVLEMARAEQLAQQANSNRRMMDIFGK